MSVQTMKNAVTLQDYADFVDDFGISITVIPRLSSILSSIASTLVIYIIFRSSTGLSSVYHRIMFGMSLSDVLSSIAIALTHIPMPRPGIDEDVDAIFNSDYLQGIRKGNEASCSAQAFCSSCGIMSTYLYNAILCWYYYFVIVRSMEDRKIVSAKLEPLFHVLCIGVPLVMNIVFLLNSAYGPGISFCTIIPFPWGCEFLNDSICKSSLMTRDRFRFILKPMIASVLSFVLLSMIFTLTSISFKIYKLNKSMQEEENSEEHRRQREALALRNNSRGLRRVAMRVEDYHASTSPPHDLEYLRLDHLTRNKHIRLQSTAYVVAFLLTSSITMYQFVAEKFPGTPALKKVHLFMQPLQGFCNFLIFVGFKVYFKKNQSQTAGYRSILYSIFFKWTADPVFVCREKGLGQEEEDSRDGRGEQIPPTNEQVDLELESTRNLNMVQFDSSSSSQDLSYHDGLELSLGQAQFPISIPRDDGPLNLNHNLGEKRNSSRLSPDNHDSDYSTGRRLSYFTQDEINSSDYEFGEDCFSNATLKR